MGLSKEEIKARSLAGTDGTKEKARVSPHFGDGGWHTQPGALWFDPRDIKPMGDHILIELDDEPLFDGVILRPDYAVIERGTRTGTVLRVGPGKFNEDQWRVIPMALVKGDRVKIGPYSDWESWDCWAQGPNIVLCQEADVRLVMTA
jgi:co-chaperonin GroES (HSP10)